MDTRAQMIEDKFLEMNGLKVKVKYFDKEMTRLIVPDEKCNWIDLRAAEKVELKKGESALISLGVAMELPEGYEAIVAPRSSTFKNWGIIQTNGIGVIDNDYNGDNDQWKLPVLATKDTVIEKGDRICQFRILKNQPCFVIEEKETLGNKDRSGFGSTGTK